MAAHARLSASTASRWMACPGSVKLSEGLPESTSVYADLGTMAHSVAAYCLRKGLNADVILEEYADALQMYLDFCRGEMRGPLDRVAIEFKTTDVLKWLDPDTGGTADFVRWRPTDAELLVVDLKFGTGVTVPVKGNKQLLTYDVGGILKFDARPRTVRNVICQPRHEDPAQRLTQDVFPAVDLLDFIADARTAAKATRAPAAPIVPGEDQCRWCPAAKARVCKQAVSYRPRSPVGALALPGEFQPVQI